MTTPHTATGMVSAWNRNTAVFIRLWPMLLAVAALGVGAGCASIFGVDHEAAAYLEPYGLRYTLDVRKHPRPLRYHVLRVDRENSRIRITAPVNPDPDGDGPAETMLDSPFDMIKRADGLAFINANAFRPAGDLDDGDTPAWRNQMPVEIIGLAVDEGTVRSPAEPGRATAFWTEQIGAAHFGIPRDPGSMANGIAGFGWLVQYGQSVAESDNALHPRTAIGRDASGRWLFLVVVDGRQRGYSEGVTLSELAQFMLDLGCQSAINLDGGGSSVMILRADQDVYRLANSPSTKVFGVSVPRPLPNALVIKAAD